MGFEYPHEMVALMVHAMRRYGRGRGAMPAGMAVHCLLSDRRVAGLGALDEKRRGLDWSSRRQRQLQVLRFKTLDLMGTRVTYHMVIDRPGYREIDKFDMPPNQVEAWTFTTVDVPAVNIHECFPVPLRNTSMQRDRDTLAKLLRRWRRDFARLHTTT